MDDQARLAEKLNDRIPRYLKDLSELASQARLVRRDVPEHKVIREVWNLIVYTSNLTTEALAFTQRLLEKPDQRVIWAKYLVLLMHEGLDTVSHIIGRVDREAKATSHISGKVFDLEAFRAASIAYKAALKPIRNDAAFMKWLKDTRNQAAAHHLSGKLASADLAGLIGWVIDGQTVGGVNSNELLINRTIELAIATVEFSKAALGALNHSKLPEVPKDADLYNALRKAMEDHA